MKVRRVFTLLRNEASQLLCVDSCFLVTLSLMFPSGQEMRSEDNAGKIVRGRPLKVSGSVTARINPNTGEVTTENQVANPKSNNAAARLQSLIRVIKTRTGGATVRQIADDFSQGTNSKLDIGDEPLEGPELPRIPTTRVPIQRVAPETTPIGEMVPEIPETPTLPPGEIIP